MIINKISKDAVKFLRTEIKWWQLPPTIMCLVLCRIRGLETSLDRDQKPDPTAQLENPSLPMQIHILYHIQFYT